MKHLFNLKKLTSIILILFLSSCKDLNKLKELSVGNSKDKLKIEIYLDSIANVYEGFRENSVIEEEMDNFLITDFPKQFNNGLLDDLPLTLYNIEKCEGRYIFTLGNSFRNENYNQALLDKVKLVIVGETDEKTAKSLIENKNYLIKGLFKEFVDPFFDKYCLKIGVVPNEIMGSIPGVDFMFGAAAIRLDSIHSFIEN